MAYKSQLLKSIKNTSIFLSKMYSDTDNLLINIGYGIDNGYVRCMLSSIASICENNKRKNIVFHIMSTSLSTENINYIKKITEVYRTKIYLYEIDVDAFRSLPTQKHLPIPTYFRFILPLILDIPKVLYIDADIICLGDISNLFLTDLKNKVIAAVPDVLPLGEKRNSALGLINHCYFNAGVLLIDVKQWNEENVVEKVMEALNNNPEKFRYLDQDALNLILTGKVYYLDLKWNHLNVIAEGQKDSIFLHFAAHPKPWNIAWPLSKFCNDFTKNIYYDYEQLTPWQGKSLEIPKNYKEMKIYAKCLMENNKYIQGVNWYLKYIIMKLFNK